MLWMQKLAPRLAFPSSFNRAYRCVVTSIKSYVMEELANLVFVGCFIAKCGPPGFQRLWAHLQPALWHYLYGRDDTQDQQRAAASSMWAYAKALEEFVLKGEVRCIPCPYSDGLAYRQDSLAYHAAVSALID